ncbi:flagellar basal body-associated protein FliL [Syntrophotalea carbinolica DSM 2380]|uniref:Flagellar protein FliL n=1 Tax=Syntrophotalea carbinolica (strain DSM 2380 / NBRC 103641 / GraBd1) TaxID=338963 RepID=Q3A5D8_SYNC1|nr:flagellar basal body-associated FliL family protein [Syntrophotalea carbinolica]ABA88419.1 flagellar basal body-associated protein FliL [Syntrophotalea carbinolica DSM 2380]
MAEKDLQQDGSAKKGNKNLIIIGILGVLLLGAIGVAAYMMGKANAPAAEQEEQTAGDTAPANGTKVLSGLMVEVEPFIVNILDVQGTRYLKASITLEVDSELAIQEATERMPQIRDAVLLLISNKTFSEMSDLQGKLQLRAELMAKINSFFRRGKVQKIYFTEFVVQ